MTKQRSNLGVTTGYIYGPMRGESFGHWPADPRQKVPVTLVCGSLSWHNQPPIMLNQTIKVTSHERDGVSNHQQLHCLFTRWFRRTSNKTSMLRVTGPFARGMHWSPEKVSMSMHHNAAWTTGRGEIDAQHNVDHRGRSTGQFQFVAHVNVKGAYIRCTVS